jgi:hypothetical protein
MHRWALAGSRAVPVALWMLGLLLVGWMGGRGQLALPQPGPSIESQVAPRANLPGGRVEAGAAVAPPWGTTTRDH